MRMLYCWATQTKTGMVWCWLSEERPVNLAEGIVGAAPFRCLTPAAVRSLFGFVPQAGRLYEVMMDVQEAL